MAYKRRNEALLCLMWLSDESNKGYRLVKRERQLGEICISIAETPPPPPHTQTHTFIRAKNHARRLLTTSKGACGAGRDSKPLHLHHWRSRERWRTRDGLGGKKKLLLDQPGLFCFSTLYSPSLWHFWDCLFVPLAGRISLVTALNERERNKERKRDRSAGRRLVCTRRGERVSGHRVCVFARWGPKTELDCPVVLPRRKKK